MVDLVKVVEMVAGAVAAETVAAVAAWAGMPDTSHTPTFDRKWTHRTSLSTMPSTGRSRASARRVARWTSRPFPATMRTTARGGHFGWFWYWYQGCCYVTLRYVTAQPPRYVHYLIIQET